MASRRVRCLRRLRVPLDIFVIFSSLAFTPSASPPPRLIFFHWLCVATFERQKASPGAMIAVEDAVDIVLERARRVLRGASATSRTERVPIDERLVGRVLARDARATTPHPSFRASVMDGYALNATATASAVPSGGAGDDEVELHALEEAAARAGPSAKTAREPLEAFECAYVTTGAEMPPGCDCVVPQEECAFVDETRKTLRVKRRAVMENEWTRAAGSDVGRGETLVSSGERLTPYDVGALKYVAEECVDTYRAPRVRILSTGDELVADASAASCAPGCVVDANGPMLRALCFEEHSEVTSFEHVRDDVEATTNAFGRALRDGACDVLITSGGASVGDRDFVERVIADFGGEIFFSRMMMKPGKPTTFATIPRGADGEKTPLLVFALPGNPVSAAVTFTLIVAPALRALSGVKEPRLRRIRCELAETLRLDAERPEYHRATIVDWCGDTPLVRSTGRQISSRLLSMRRADVLVELPRGPGAVEKGSIASALVVCDLRRTEGVNAQKIRAPERNERRRNECAPHVAAAAAATQVNVFTNDEQCHRLKRVVGLEEAIRRACRESGGDVVVDSMLSTTTAYSDGAVHAIMTDSNSEELKRAIEKTAKRLRDRESESEDIIVERAYARVGLMGNPGDAYGGKVIAAAISNFYAEVTLRPRRDTRVSFVPNTLDANSFESFDAMTSHLSEFGVDGGIRLLKSLARRLCAYFEKSGRNVHISRGFDVSYSSTIPIQLGLSGSSAIVVAGVNAMLKFFGACDVPLCDRATLALRVEQDVGISAGPMDRFIQVYGGLRLMDFSEFRETERAVVENLDASNLPPLFLVWLERGNASHSGRVHSRVKKRFEDGERSIVDAVQRLSALTERAAACMRQSSNAVASALPELMNLNFTIRRELFDDDELGVLNLEMVRVLRDECGYGVKFAGSGGACVVAGAGVDDAGAELLARTCRARGWKHERIAIHPPHHATV